MDLFPFLPEIFGRFAAESVPDRPDYEIIPECQWLSVSIGAGFR